MIAYIYQWLHLASDGRGNVVGVLVCFVPSGMVSHLSSIVTIQTVISLSLFLDIFSLPYINKHYLSPSSSPSLDHSQSSSLTMETAVHIGPVQPSIWLICNWFSLQSRNLGILQPIHVGPWITQAHCNCYN